MTDRHPPAHPDPSDSLEATVRTLVSLGEQALADDEAHGTAWGAYADWAWRTGIDALPSSPPDVATWLATDATDLRPSRIAEVLDAIAAAHRSAGHADPTEGVRP